MRIIIFVAVFFLQACQNILVKPAETSPAPISDVSLPWGQQDWTNELLGKISEKISSLDKASSDMGRFCKNYSKLDQRGKVVAWGFLAVAISKFESGWKPGDSMTESNGVDSEGLFQLSYGDSHCPKNKASGNIRDPKVNITCAVAIMADLAADDAVVASGGYVKFGAPPARGLARYWSVLRVPDSKSRHHLSEIRAMTAKAPGCI